MNQLEKSHLINENILDQGYYFQTLFHEAGRRNLLSSTQIERIQVEIVELMGKEVERYTNDESSSVPIEKAQELLQSITYSMGFYLKSVPDMTEKIETLKKEKMSVIFYKGMEGVSVHKAKARMLLQNLQKNGLKLNNYAYQDTIFTGIPEFFHDYNIEFGASDIPGSIDYPLSMTITDLLGVEYIYEYLRYFTLEHNLIKLFSVQTINQLLLGFDKEAEHVLVNIFELVLTNALGCVLLGHDIRELDIHSKDLQWLQDNMENLSLEDLQQRLRLAFKTIVEEFTLEAETLAYTKVALSEIAIRLKNNLQTNTLDKLFVSFHSKESLEKEFLVEGVSMEDEQLRDLIENIKVCSLIEDKVALFRDHVRSLADLIEILEECFYGDEYVEVFKLLTETERVILKKSIEAEAGLEGLEDYKPEKEWQKKLLTI